MRRRAALVTAIIIAAILFLLAGPGTAFYTDYLWFGDVGYRRFFTTQVTTQTVLFALSAALFAAIAGANVYLARRLSPLRPLAITNDFLFNLRRTLDPMIRLTLSGIVALGAIMFGSVATPLWQDALLFMNSQKFGRLDPLFHRDVGFYIFDLPIWSFIFTWVFWVLLVTILVSAAVYAYAGALGPQPEGGYVAPQPRTHLSVLLGFLLLTKAALYQVDQWELLTSTAQKWQDDNPLYLGRFSGAFYTEVKAQLPAYRVLFWVAILAAILLFVTFLTKRLVLPIVAVALMGLSALLIGGAYPRIVQQFWVIPSATTLQQPYIPRNIEATRNAFGLDKVRNVPFAARSSVSAEDLTANSETLANVRLWDDQPLLKNLQQTQEFTPYYQFNRVGVDRYPVQGETTQTLIAARQVTQGTQSQNWQNAHLTYTHGYGLVASRSNDVTPVGDPSLLVSGLPVRNTTESPSLDLKQPRIYFGANDQDPQSQASGDFIIVGTNVAELDPPRQATGSESEATPYRYTGKSGISLGSMLTRLAYAIRFGDTKLLLSSNIKDRSRLIYDRDVLTRVGRVAPFLVLDQSPYLVVDGGKLVWVVDAYTVSGRYPYAQPLSDTFAMGTQFEGVNYVRNSVKATVDAFSGKVDLYLFDTSDPIAKAWSRAIPGLFRPHSKIPATIRRHFRYPLDLFTVQLATWSMYHQGNREDFFKNTSPWEVSRTAAQRSSSRQTSPAGISRSQYLMLRLPGAEDVEFVLFNSYTFKDKPNMSSLFVARSDPAHYGELVSLDIPGDRQVKGPAQVTGNINSVPGISERQSLLSQGSSDLDQGQVRLVPVGESLLYVQPWYVSSSKERPQPQLKAVIVAFGDRIEIGDSFPQALERLFGFSPLTGTTGPGTGGTTTPPGPGTEPTPGPGPLDAQAVAALVAQASTLYEQMQQALKEGDLERYGKLQKELGAVLEKLTAATGSQAGTAGTPKTDGTNPKTNGA